MRTQRWNLAFGLGVLLVAALGCSFSASTANISSLKLGKDKAATQETSTYAPSDTIYAVAEISNSPEGVKAKGHLIAEDVAGVPAGPITGLETTLELPGSASASYNFTPPATGWPKGKYKMEVLMMNMAGEQKDQKSVSFTVS